jgi:branched-chain amino acid transport system permease protein
MGGSKMDVKTNVSSGKMTIGKTLGYVAIAAAVVLVPILFQASGWGFMVRILAIVGIYVMLALGLNIVVGFAGLLDLGYIAFMAIGAYVAVITTQTVILSQAVGVFTAGGGTAPAGLNLWQLMTYGAPMQELAANPAFSQAIRQVSTTSAILPWMFLICIPLAAAGAAATGIMLGTPVLRLRGDYLAIVTLGFGEIVRIIITNNAFGLTGGAAGLPRAGVILPDPIGLKWLSEHLTVRFSNSQFTVDPNLYWYFVIVMFCLATIFVVRRLDDSRLGRGWTAMREDEVAASSMGVNIMTSKLWAFSLGALSGGLAGLVFVNLQGSVTPETFNFMESVFVVSIVVLGGMGSIPGAIVGGLIITGIPATIQGLAASGKLPIDPATATVIGNYRYLVFGLLMVVMMAWRPQGILPSSRRARELHPETEKMLDDENEALYDAQHDVDIPGEDL